jgi:GDP-L-fucose synthase
MSGAIITGGTGFIGSRLADELRARGVTRVFAIGSRDVDLVNRERALEWFEHAHWLNEITDIFHLAAVYKAGGWPAAHPATQFHTNMGMNLSVLEGWRRFFPEARLTSVVSYCMYPDHDRPHPESELWGTEPEPYLASYAFTKKALLVGQNAYANEFGLRAASLVLPTVYGPRDDFSELSHVIGALIGKFVRAARDGSGSVEVWGTGEQKREFIHVDDVVDALLTLAAHPDPPDVVNLGAGRTVQIRQLAELIAEAAGYGGEIVFNPDRFVGALSRSLDTTKLGRELGWTPKVSIEDGINATVQWYSRRLAADFAVANQV